MRKRTILTVLLVLVCFGMIGSAGVIGYHFVNRKAQTLEEMLPREIEATWYAGYPVKNTITLYKDGGYTSEYFGGNIGTYEMPDEHTVILTDEFGDITEAAIGEDMILSFVKNEMTYKYYLDPDFADSLSDTQEDPEIVSLRRTTIKKILSQGHWISEDMSTLRADMNTITINGISHGYEVSDIKALADGYEFNLIDGGSYHLSGRIIVNMETMRYTVQIEDMTFTADGSGFLLDS